MNPDWVKVERELRNWHGELSELSPMSYDTLYGSVMSLRWPGLCGMDMTMEDALANYRDAVMTCSIIRLRKLKKQPNFRFKAQPPERCRIGFGTFGWKYNHDIIHEVVNKGLLIDTAEGYGFGRVEIALGEALKGFPTAEVTTKVRRDHMSPQSLENAMMRSRKKLGITPHYQLHYPQHLRQDAILQLADFRKRGLIKSVGIGNCSVDQIEMAQRMLSDYSGDVLRSVQISFSLLNQRAKHTVIPYCQERGILVIAYSPLGQSYKKLITPILSDMARKYKTQPTTVALAWILSFPGVMPIPRTNNIKHLRQNFDAMELLLKSEDIEELETAYGLL